MGVTWMFIYVHLKLMKKLRGETLFCKLKINIKTNKFVNLWRLYITVNFNVSVSTLDDKNLCTFNKYLMGVVRLLL